MNPRVLHTVGMKEKPESKNFIAVMHGPITLARDSRVDSVDNPVPEVNEIKLSSVRKTALSVKLWPT